jgi:hypothetical protein
MYKLHYPRAKGSMLKESPGSIFFRDSTGYRIRPRGTTFKFEYFREFKSEFEKNSGYESGIHMGSMHEINMRPKISCYCPFKSDKIFFDIGSSYKLLDVADIIFNVDANLL